MSKLCSSLFILLCVTSFEVQSQNLKFGLTTGVGTFSMKGPKAMQNHVFNDINLNNLKITESFPAYAIFGFDVLITNYRITQVYFLRYESTGGRIAYTDYSGSYSYDQLVNQFILGAGVEKRSPISRNENFHFFIGVKTGISISYLALKQSLTVYDQFEVDDIKLQENSFFLEPSMGIVLSLDKIEITPFVGYYFDPIKTGLFLKSNRDKKLNTNDNTQTHLQWMGFRSGLRVALKAY